MVTDIPMIISTLKGLFSMKKYVLENRNGQFGTILLPSEYLRHVSSEKDTDNIVNELVTLIISGRLH